jgi:hypothetical protein
MNEEFIIPVSFKGEELAFKARLLNFGYIHKIQVEVNGVDVLFEPDEERNYRVVVDPVYLEGNNMVDVELLKAIACTIESAV